MNTMNDTTPATVTGKRTTTYRNEYGDTTTSETEADGWSDAALAVDSRAPDGDWRPWNYEGEHPVTADRIAYYAARKAALEGGA